MPLAITPIHGLERSCSTSDKCLPIIRSQDKAKKEKYPQLIKLTSATTGEAHDHRDGVQSEDFSTVKDQPILTVALARLKIKVFLQYQLGALGSSCCSVISPRI